MQFDQADCGIACLISIIKYHGGVDTFENLRNECGTFIGGTTLLGIHRAAEKSGFSSEGCKTNTEFLKQHKTPCILYVVMDNECHHYVVSYGTQTAGDTIQFIIGDPAKGIIYLTEDQLGKVWRYRTCLILSPNLKFVKTEDIVNKKRKWLYQFLKKDFSLLIIAALLGIIIAALSLSMAIFSQKLIDVIIPKKLYTKLGIGITLVFLLLIIKEGLSFLRQFFLLKQSRSFNSRVIDFFYNHLLQLPTSFFGTRKVGELTARLNDTSRIQRVISQLVGTATIDLLMTLATTVVIFHYSWQIGIGCMLGMTFFFFFVHYYKDQIISGQSNIMISYAMVESNYISTLQGINSMKNYNKQQLYSNINRDIYHTYQNNLFNFGKIQVTLSFFVNSFGALFLTSVLGFGSYKVLNNNMKIGELMAIIGMCGTLLPSVTNLSLIAIPINEAKIAFNRMFEYTSIEQELDSGTVEISSISNISIKNLAFSFGGRGAVLKDISFKVSRNEIVALMGENGCGKSTLTELLFKNYLFTEGEVIINDCHDIRDVKRSNWRNLTKIVPQNLHMFNASILENIAFEDGFNKPEKVINFLADYGFNTFFETLPYFYHTIIGDQGINISGGQKQLIALARALYHNPKLLILDEGTASMDRDTELFVLKLLNNLKENMAIIFITHRLHVLKAYCDKIYIVDKGIITSSGNHDELLQTENLYSQYWQDLKI